jgi:hypothetical protein
MRLAFFAVVLGLGASVASADVLTIAITGQVISVSDSSLGVTVGQAVSGTYSYDTSTPVGSNNTYTLASPPRQYHFVRRGRPDIPDAEQLVVSDCGGSAECAGTEHIQLRGDEPVIGRGLNHP